jgi:DNA repair protein RecO
MSHRFYHTEGFVLRHRARGEANKLLYLLTPDFGRCLVMAQGVRQGQSKLRPNLSDYSYGHFSLVRGREFWRLVSAEQDPRFSGLYDSALKRKIVSQLFLVLTKILVAEEESQLLFSNLMGALSTLKLISETDPAIFMVERLFLLRLMKYLGYWPAETPLERFVADEVWSLDLLVTLQQTHYQQLSLETINNFFREHQW